LTSVLENKEGYIEGLAFKRKDLCGVRAIFLQLPQPHNKKRRPLRGAFS
jgi:hypothetical protein